MELRRVERKLAAILSADVKGLLTRIKSERTILPHCVRQG